MRLSLIFYSKSAATSSFTHRPHYISLDKPEVHEIKLENTKQENNHDIALGVGIKYSCSSSILGRKRKNDTMIAAR